MATPEELSAYWDRLNRHDWWYMMSDDHNVYRRGSAAESKILTDAMLAARKGDADFLNLFQEFQAHARYLDTDGSKRPAKPPRPIPLEPKVQG
jgi:hypothetical protein